MDVARVLLTLGIVFAGSAQAGTEDPASFQEQGALALHVVARNEQSPCSEGFDTGGGIATAVDLSTDGSPLYLVYVIGVPEGSNTSTHWGIAGADFGIEYGNGVKVEDWRTCAQLEFAGRDWPTSSSGTLVTWEPSNSCQRRDRVVVGFFTTSARKPTVMSIIPDPRSGSVRIAACDASETDLTSLEVDRVGWVSFGGAAKGMDTDGCNPLLEPCIAEVVPAYPVTWGWMKSRSWQ
jgi:hypothetical protein